MLDGSLTELRIVLLRKRLLLLLYRHVHNGVVRRRIRVGDNNRDGVVARLHVQARLDGDGAVLTDGCPLRSVGTLRIGGTRRCLRGVLRGSGILLFHPDGVVLGLINFSVFAHLGRTQRLVLIGHACDPQTRRLPEHFSDNSLPPNHIAVNDTAVFV